MGIIDNYRRNTTAWYIATVPFKVSGEQYIDNLVKLNQSSELDINDFRQKAKSIAARIEKRSNHGKTIADPVIGNEISKYIEAAIELYIANVNYHYSSKLIVKINNLADAVLNGLEKSDARRRFRDYRDELDAIVNYDKAVLMFLASYNDLLL